MDARMTLHTLIFFCLALGFATVAISILGWMIVHGGARKPTPPAPVLPNGRIIGGKK